MDELLEQFLIESRDLVAQAEADFAALAHDPQDVGAIDSAFRAIHTLKGSVGVFALTPAERVLHIAEDLLASARKGLAPLDAPALAALVASLDQTDRWIDETERTGALKPGADQIADRICAQLASHGTAEPAPKTGTAPVEAEAAADAEDWAAALVSRHAGVIAEAGAALTAFRYAPDPDCFFRGEDPLAVVALVPGLVALDIGPASGTWPDADALEPFTCISVIEGLSAAPHDAVHAAFRLMPDQVSSTTIAATSETARSDGRTLRGATVRVEAARLTDLADGLGELLVVVNGLAGIARQAEGEAPALTSRIRGAHDDLERISSKLHRSLSAVRSVPLEPALRRLPRMAREIAEGVGKTIDFALTGQGIEADRQIADGLFEPLLHLLRNAIDHGIEAPDSRAAAGKPAQGRIALALRRDGDIIEASLEDDGAGIDPDRIRRVAIDRRLVDEVEAGGLSDAAALRLIFEPGFSTAGTVTELSGRGVGMNAVQVAVAALRGTVDVESQPGKGTQFRIRIPANALTTRLLVIEAGGDRYGVSLDQVVETVRISSEDLLPVGTGVACVLREKTVPVLDLADLVGARGRSDADTARDHVRLIVTRSRGEPVALRIDGLGERIDTLVRAPGGLLASVPGIMGSTVLGDGGVLLVLDLPELAA